MKKVEINNEIVLLRQYVRQARICVINKLIREAKRLRTTNHGTEKQLEKNKNKADKLLREVFALKRIKDDEISKFGIVNFEYLEDIVRNPRTDDGTRAMVKVVCYKSLSSRIAEFQDKFPDYGEYITLKRTKGSPKKKESCPVNVPERRSKRLQSAANDITETVQRESLKDTEEDVASSAGTSREKGTKVAKKRGKSSKEEETGGEAKEEEDVAKAAKIRDAEVESKAGQCSKVVAKIISTQATVKRFAEVLQESVERSDASDEALTKTRETCNETAEMPKKADDFFLQADGATSHLSTALSYEDKNPSSEFESRSTSKASRFDERARKQRRDARGQKLNDRNASRGGRNARESGNARSQENRKSVRAEERSGGKSTSAVEKEGLHPSWAAKRKQQDMIKQGFQGKKIKFDED